MRVQVLIILAAILAGCGSAPPEDSQQSAATTTNQLPPESPISDPVASPVPSIAAIPTESPVPFPSSSGIPSPSPSPSIQASPSPSPSPTPTPSQAVKCTLASTAGYAPVPIVQIQATIYSDGTQSVNCVTGYVGASADQFTTGTLQKQVQGAPVCIVDSPYTTTGAFTFISNGPTYSSNISVMDGPDLAYYLTCNVQNYSN